jgi:hypothetical protein
MGRGTGTFGFEFPMGVIFPAAGVGVLARCHIFRRASGTPVFPFPVLKCPQVLPVIPGGGDRTGLDFPARTCADPVPDQHTGDGLVTWEEW